MPEASAMGGPALRPLEEKPGKTGETNDVGARLVVEWMGDVR